MLLIVRRNKQLSPEARSDSSSQSRAFLLSSTENSAVNSASPGRRRRPLSTIELGEGDVEVRLQGPEGLSFSEERGTFAGADF